jgi:hypothetical protein
MTREAVAGRDDPPVADCPRRAEKRAGQRTWDVVVGVTTRVVETSTQV